MGELEAVIKAGCPFKAYVVEADEEDGGKSNRFAERLRRQIREVGDSSRYDFQCKKFLPKTIPQVLVVGENGEAFRFEKDPERHAAVGDFGGSDKPAGKDLAEFVKERLDELFAPTAAA